MSSLTPISSVLPTMLSAPSSVPTVFSSIPQSMAGMSMVGGTVSSVSSMVGSLSSIPQVTVSSMQSMVGSVPGIPSVSQMVGGVPYLPGASFTMVPSLQFATMDHQLPQQVTIQHLVPSMTAGFAMQQMSHQSVIQPVSMQQQQHSAPHSASAMLHHSASVNMSADTVAGNLQQNVLQHLSQNKLQQISPGLHHGMIQEQEMLEEEEGSDEEDIHLCGKCKQKFTNIEIFLDHRKKCSMKSRKTKMMDLVKDEKDQKIQVKLPSSSGASPSKIVSIGKDYEVSDRLVLEDGRTYTVTEAVQVSVPDFKNIHNNAVDTDCVQRANSVDSFHNNAPIIIDAPIMVDNDEKFVDVYSSTSPDSVVQVVGDSAASSVSLQNSSLSQRSLLDSNDGTHIASGHHMSSVVTTLPSEVSCTLNMSLEGSSVTFPLQFQVQQNLSEHETLEAIESSGQLQKSPSEDEEYGSVVTITKFPDFTMKSLSEQNKRIKSSTNLVKKETVTVAVAVVPKTTSFSNRKLHGCTFIGCLFSAKYAKDLVRHMRKHTGEKPFSCDTCGKSFGRMDKLTRHIQIHTGNKPFCCGVCNYRTSERFTLKKHMRVHTDERPFHCQICPYSSKDSSQLTVHLRSHTGDSPFLCQVEGCMATFKTNSDLTRHIRIHTGEKPYKCDYCDHRVSIKSNLKNHIRANHRSSEVFKCSLDVCEYTTSSKAELKEHHKIHNNPSLVELNCPHCPFSSDNRHKLARHIGDHTINHPNSFKCSYCSYSSKSQSLLSSHINKKHGTWNTKEKPKQVMVKDPLKITGRLKMNKVKPKQNQPKKKTGKTIDSTDSQKKRRSVLSKTICKPNFVCPVCPAGFVRRDSLRSHVKQHKATNVEDSALTAAVENYIGGNINSDTESVTIVTSNQPPPGLSNHMTVPTSSQHPVEFIMPCLPHPGMPLYIPTMDGYK